MGKDIFRDLVAVGGAVTLGLTASALEKPRDVQAAPELFAGNSGTVLFMERPSAVALIDQAQARPPVRPRPTRSPEPTRVRPPQPTAVRPPTAAPTRVPAPTAVPPSPGQPKPEPAPQPVAPKPEQSENKKSDPKPVPTPELLIQVCPPPLGVTREWTMKQIVTYWFNQGKTPGSSSAEIAYRDMTPQNFGERFENDEDLNCMVRAALAQAKEAKARAEALAAQNAQTDIQLPPLELHKLDRYLEEDQDNDDQHDMDGDSGQMPATGESNPTRADEPVASNGGQDLVAETPQGDPEPEPTSASTSTPSATATPRAVNTQTPAPTSSPTTSPTVRVAVTATPNPTQGLTANLLETPPPFVIAAPLHIPPKNSFELWCQQNHCSLPDNIEDFLLRLGLTVVGGSGLLITSGLIYKRYRK